MLRFLAQTALNLIANALGLFAASIILPGFSISAIPFIVAVLIFTVIEILVSPLLKQMSDRNVPALSGGIALVSTFVSLLVTSLISDGISISGLNTWVLATLIVWVFSLISTLVLPLFLFKKTLANRRDNT